MTRYRVTEPKHENQGYGILIIKEKLIEDISPIYSAVKRLADECNRGQVELEDFDDILDSFLSDFATF
ncbi:MAG: hypothetical protein IIU14_05540 [Ruminococcus sp.]|nr:hypothetical protein [Ruminococcus sp.]